jgi:hypothetical protein
MSAFTESWQGNRTFSGHCKSCAMGEISRSTTVLPEVTVAVRTEALTFQPS